MSHKLFMVPGATSSGLPVREGHAVAKPVSRFCLAQAEYRAIASKFKLRRHAPDPSSGRLTTRAPRDSRARQGPW